MVSMFSDGTTIPLYRIRLAPAGSGCAGIRTGGIDGDGGHGIYRHAGFEQLGRCYYFRDRRYTSPCSPTRSFLLTGGSGCDPFMRVSASNSSRLENGGTNNVRDPAAPLKLVARKLARLGTGLGVSNPARAAEDVPVKREYPCPLNKLLRWLRINVQHVHSWKGSLHAPSSEPGPVEMNGLSRMCEGPATAEQTGNASIQG